MTIIDLYAGAGGWDVAARIIGLPDPIGYENMPAAIATRQKAGFPTVDTDLLTFNPATLLDEQVEGLIASPPCQSFSLAGSGAGRRDLDKVLAGIRNIRAGLPAWHSIDVTDERTKHVLIPLQWALCLKPAWVSWEQVPTVLPVWEACAEVLREHGYSVAVGNLSAEQYGVPQTRKRAILIARKNGEAVLPAPTHSRYRKGKPRQEGDLLPWVSMADALGWADGSLVGFPRRSDGKAEVIVNGESYRARDLREASAPSQVVTEKARSWSLMPGGRSGCGEPRDINKPAATLVGKGTVMWASADQWYGRARQTARYSTAACEVCGDDDATSNVAVCSDCVLLLDQTPPAHLGDGPITATDALKNHSGLRPGEVPPVFVGSNQLKQARRSANEPASTIAFGHNRSGVGWFGVGDDQDSADFREAFTALGQQQTYRADVSDYKPWTQERPATTIAARDLVPDPGTNANRFNGATKSRNDGVRVSVQEAALLQSFPADHPFQGSKTSQFLQVGNAIPPLLAVAVLKAAVGEDSE